MPHFTLNIDAGGPLVNALVQVSEGRRAALQAQHLAIPESRVIRALVDTGASFTAIEPSVLQLLELTPTGTMDIITPSTGQNVHTTETYDVDFVMYASVDDPPLSMPNLRVAACQLFLIGRDVLKRCILIYNGQHNTFSLAF